MMSQILLPFAIVARHFASSSRATTGPKHGHHFTSVRLPSRVKSLFSCLVECSFVYRWRRARRIHHTHDGAAQNRAKSRIHIWAQCSVFSYNIIRSGSCGAPALVRISCNHWLLCASHSVSIDQFSTTDFVLCDWTMFLYGTTERNAHASIVQNTRHRLRRGGS